MLLSHRADRWLYRGKRPHGLARVLNRAWGGLAGAGLAPRRLVRLEVTGRRSGRTISLPVVVADYQGERYLASMLGEGADWVHNVRAAGGRAVLRHGHREEILLEEVDPGQRAPILRRYLECAPGARPHIPVDRRAPIEDLNQVAMTIPVFHVTAAQSASVASRDPHRPGPGRAIPVAGASAAGPTHRPVNLFVGALLRSPIHSLLSGSVLLLTVKGRRTGRYHTFPVQYARAGQTLYIVPGGHEHKNWWRNLGEPAPVRLRIQGHDAVGTGQVLRAGDAEFIPAMRIYLARFPVSARPRRLAVVDGRPIEDDQARQAATADDVIVRVRLEP